MKRTGFTALLVSAIILAGSLRVTGEEAADDSEQLYRSTLLFAHVLETIRDQYVDASGVDYEKLTFAALEGMLSSLDPYSEFLDPQRYQAMRSETEGEFGGIGIYVGVTSSRNLLVNMPVEGGPAFKAGLLPGDWIVKINGEATRGLAMSDAVRMLRGRPGEVVTLVIYRPDTKESKEVEVVRELINVPTVRGTRILDEYSQGDFRIGYVRIAQFGEKTVGEFQDALKQLSAEGMTALVLDLRNNPGGLLESAVQVAGKFTPPGTVIVSTRGREAGVEEAKFPARGRQHLDLLPLVVLINRHSASAAEIVAGALKDLDRALVVGETSYGKGSVQTVQPVEMTLDLPPGPVGIRLTTAKYFTPSHNVIHMRGISPDIYVPVSRAEERAVLQRQNWHLLSPEDRESVTRQVDTRLDRAVAAMLGRHLYHQRMVGLMQ